MRNYCWGDDEEDSGGEAMFGVFSIVSWLIIIGFIAIFFSILGIYFVGLLGV